eukprot:evm.model.NODE_30636_length_21967_cov_24.367916.5
MLCTSLAFSSLKASQSLTNRSETLSKSFFFFSATSTALLHASSAAFSFSSFPIIPTHFPFTCNRNATSTNAS